MKRFYEVMAVATITISFVWGFYDGQVVTSSDLLIQGLLFSVLAKLQDN